MIPPRTGTAADVAYLALPPTAVDARPSGDTRLIVAWNGFGPPRTPAALASALSMTGVPTWRVYLHLPAPAGEGPAERFAAIVEEAAGRFPAVLEEIRRALGLEPGPIGLTGFSAGATVAMLVLASGAVPVSAAAFVSPIVSPIRTPFQTTTEAAERADRLIAWTEESRATAERLDLTTRAGDLARAGAPVLLVGGSRDRLVRPSDLTRLHDRLNERGGSARTVTFRMDHCLADEPGVDARPPLHEAVSVDGALTDWFRSHLATIEEPAQGHAPAQLQGPGPSPEETIPDGMWSQRRLNRRDALPAPRPHPQQPENEASSPLTAGTPRR